MIAIYLGIGVMLATLMFVWRLCSGQGYTTAEMGLSYLWVVPVIVVFWGIIVLAIAWDMYERAKWRKRSQALAEEERFGEFG